MTATENSVNNVTNLDDARKARAKAKAAEAAANAEINSDSPHGNRRFDAEKVARLKAAIAAGEYKIDAARVADKFIEHDRNQ